MTLYQTIHCLYVFFRSPNFEVPVMEVIYQSLVAQINILAAKKAIVDSCEAKMKKFKKNRTLRSQKIYTG